MRTLLGFAALAAFVAYCFTRGDGAAAPGSQPASGDGDRRVPRRPPPAPHVHAGDPTVRH